MEYLTVGDYAALRGCSERYARQLITKGQLLAEEITGVVGNSGKQYRIPLAGIEKKYIKKWNRLHTSKTKKAEDPENIVTINVDQNLETLTSTEREEVTRWKEILTEWQQYRDSADSKIEADERYMDYLAETYPDMKFSQRILYRKLAAWKECGDLVLVDRRGKHGNHAKAIQDEVFDIFEYYYLDESRKTVSRCVELTELEIKKNRDDLHQYLPLASLSTFARAIEVRIAVPVLKYYRLGEKVFRDECAPYIKRMYDDLASNDIWVCDNHTFDIFVDGGESDKPIRVYLTGFLDVRSRKMVGWYVTDAPRSDATLYALRRGIERYGIPKMIYSDNGREFLTHDIGGRGFRKSAAAEHEPLTILQHLGIEFRTALVKNAKAKIIERAFREVKECFSRLFAGYTGGTIAERPERLKKTGKFATNFTAAEEFTGYVDTYIEGHFNIQPHKGAGMGGKTPNQVFAQCLYEQRVATAEQLNLMMLRNSRTVKVQRHGVSLKLYEKELFFNSEELLMNHIGEKVYYRFNPDELDEVRVYNAQDQFICTAQRKTQLSYHASKEEIQKAMKENRELEKTVKAYMKKKNIEAEDALSLIMDEAAARMEEREDINPKIIIPVRSREERADSDIYEKAAGMEPIDWTAALERLKKVKEE